MVGLGADEVAADVWHPLRRVQTVAYPGGDTSVLYYDRVYAPVPHVVGDDLPTWEALRLGPSSIGYAITGPGHALVIGGGGGRDIYNALTSAQTVDVIELNSAIRDAVDDSLGPWSGSPCSRPGVSTTIGDGRAILAGRDTAYDQIHIGFTDTLSANAAQGFALSENRPRRCLPAPNHRRPPSHRDTVGAQARPAQGEGASGHHAPGGETHRYRPLNGRCRAARRRRWSPP